MGRLEGKVALIFGAGGGIGRATSERFIDEGCSVVAADIDPAAATASIESSSPGNSLAVDCDVTDGASIERAVAAAQETFGRLTTICNFAGGSTPRDAPAVEAPTAEFWRVIGLDLFGTFMSAKFGIPELIRAGGGSIINMSSIVAMTGVEGLDCYTSAKGGIGSLTRSLAVQFAAQNVRVNAIAPGITLTPRVRATPTSVDPDARLVQRHLLGLVDPVDIAHLAVYLAAEESRRVTGQIMRVDSGATL